MTAIDKKLAVKAEREGFLKFETRVTEEKRQEMRKMEEMKKNMISTIKEMENKIESTEIELENKRMAIKQLGMDIMELVVIIESGGLSEGEKEEIEKKKNWVEIKKLSKTRKS